MEFKDESKETIDPFKSKNEISRTFYSKNDKNVNLSKMKLYEESSKNPKGILKQSSS